MQNPFKYGGIVRGPYFADREQELAELAGEMRNLGRVFLVSPRRFGKTCLLFNLMDKLRELDFATAYLDLNAYPDVSGFAAALTRQTSQALETNTDKLLKIFAGLQRLRPKVAVGPDGSVSAGVEVAVEEKHSLSALLEGLRHAESLAQHKQKKLIVVIDEFSDLTKYNGQALEKALRSEIQIHEHVGYIFSGSEQSIMLSMIRDRQRAFYKLGRIMELAPIKRNHYSDFILNWLRKGGYRVELSALDRIFELGRDVPYNIQRMCHNMWERARESGQITAELIEELPLVVARQDSPHYELLWQTASQAQKTLLMALSADPFAKPFSREFQLKYGVGPSSSIKASLDSLAKKGIIFKTLDGAYRFVDTFMTYWIKGLKRDVR